jgi:Obg family GTPase CgtA-like protein
VAELMTRVCQLIKKEKDQETNISSGTVILQPQERAETSLVNLEDEIYVIRSESLERFVRGSDTQDAEVRRQLRMLLTKNHVRNALAAAGAQQDSIVRCGTFIFKL